MFIKSPIFMFLPLLFLSSCLISLGYEVPDPRTELDRCLQRCHETEKGFPGIIECAARCERKYGDREWSGEEEEDAGVPPKDPKSLRWKIEQCQRKCREEETQERKQKKCEKRCEEAAIKEREREQEKGQERKHRHEKGGEEAEGEDREHQRGSSEYSLVEVRTEDNPYFFQSQKFTSSYKSQEGRLKVLERFSKWSKLLQGIDNYRLVVFEANPNTISIPHHSDAEAIFVVLNGKGTITFVLRDKREIYNVESYDVIRIPAGTTVYTINRDNNEKLRIAALLKPVNIPGNFKGYFAAGGENPESFFKAFSNDILETAFKTPADQLDKLFGQQKKGFVLKASREQIKALTEHASSTRQRGHEFRDPFSLLNQQPIYSNNHGKFFEASPEDYKQLQDMDISVTLAEINRGALMVPHYNSRTTTIVLVVEGRGRFEMACPHLARQSPERPWEKEQRSEEREEETESSGQYQKISSQLSPGDVFIIPAGHPVAVLASENENLRTLGFGINAINNERNFLAGGDNILNQIEREAKGLSFNLPPDFVEQVFGNQKESHFVAGPQQGHRREEGRGHPLSSVFDLAGFF